MSTVLYLYGFVPLGTSRPVGGLAGLDAREVRVLELEPPVAAVLSELDAGEYGQGSIESHLKDLAWVADRGALHERVVTWFSDHASIVPARFLTVFTSEQALRAEVHERLPQITEHLRRFQGVREWDIKVSYDLETLVGSMGEVSEKVAALDSEIAGAAPGRRYLLERRRDEVARAEAVSVARRLARDFLDALRPWADEVTELDLPARRDDVSVVLSAALLVRKGEADAFGRAAGDLVPDLERRGIRVGLTGPWAPYRFMREEARG